MRMYTLRTLIKEFEFEEGSALKMDCEGCEYEAVLNADPCDLAVFSQIVIEYHNGYREIMRHLEAAGFSTEIKPMRSLAIPIESRDTWWQGGSPPPVSPLVTCSPHFGGSPLSRSSSSPDLRRPSAGFQSWRTSAAAIFAQLGPANRENRLRPKHPRRKRHFP